MQGAVGLLISTYLQIYQEIIFSENFKIGSDLTELWSWVCWPRLVDPPCMYDDMIDMYWYNVAETMGG